MASLEQLVEMGLDRKQAIAALRLSNGNIDQALDLIYTNPELLNEQANNANNNNAGEDQKENEKEKEEEEKMDIDENLNEGNGSLYNMYGFITHLGKNTDHGHYVCHIRQEGNKWTYFNDSKVTLWEDPPIRKGYIYLYRNNTNEKK